MRSGGRPVISASRAFAHVDALLAECPGLSQRHIARLAGLSESGMSVARRTGRIDPDTEERLLAVTARHVRLMPPPQMPAHIARDHVTLLMEQTGVTRHCIARAADVNYQTVYNVMKPDKPIVKWRVHHALMTTTAEDVRRVEFWTERWPSIVRLRALQANGWSLERLSPQWGMNLSAHANADPASPIECAVARQIKAIYEHLGDETGPSERARQAAGRLGFKPPIYYDEDMRPVLVETGSDLRRQQKARTDLAIAALTIEGRDVPAVMEALRVSDRTISRARSRFGISQARVDAGLVSAHEVAVIRAATRGLHYWSVIDMLDEPGLDYVALSKELAANLSNKGATLPRAG